MFARLVWLSLAAFAIGTETFMIGGLLPRIAGDLGVSAAICGQLVTIFSLTYAVAAPVLFGLFPAITASQADRLAERTESASRQTTVMRDVLVCAVATAAQASRMAKRQMEARRCGMWDSFPVSAQESLWWLARRSGDL